MFSSHRVSLQGALLAALLGLRRAQGVAHDDVLGLHVAILVRPQGTFSSAGFVHVRVAESAIGPKL